MEGYPRAAEKFSKEANLQEQREDSEIADRREIQDAIHSGEIEVAIAGLNRLDPEVRSYSYFHAPSAAMIRIRVSTCTTLRPRPLMRNNHLFYEQSPVNLSLLSICWPASTR